MAVNVPLVHISELAEATTAADTDCMVVGGSDAKKITIPNLAKAILAKAAGAVSTIMSANLTASRALVSNGSGKVAVSDITATELGYLEGVKSSVQKQFDELNGNKTLISEDTTIPSATYASGAQKLVTIKNTHAYYPVAVAIVGADPTSHIIQYTVSGPTCNNGNSDIVVTVRNGYTTHLTTALQIRVWYLRTK